MLYLCFQHLCSSLRKFVAYVTFSRCFSRGRGVSTPRSASHRRGPRDTLHLTRHIQAQTRKILAPSALGSTKPADTRHRLHPTRQNPTKTNQTVASSAVSAQKPTPPPHQPHPTRHIQAQTRKIVAPSAAGSTKHADTRHRLHPTRHNQAQTRQTVALGAAGARKHWRAHPPRVSPPALHVQRRSLTVEGR